MSTPPLLGYQAPASYSAGSSPFDIAGIAASIDRAASSLSAEERGSLTVQATQSGVGAGLVVRLPMIGGPRILATVTKPWAGQIGWSLAGRVSFLTTETPKPVLLAPKLRGLYRLFRAAGNGKLGAAMKAVAVNRGAEVRLAR